MSIGIRKKRYANELKCLITLGLLTSQFCGYAQTFSLEEFFRVVAKDTLQVINTSSFDSTSIKRHNSGSLNFNAKRLIIPGAFIAVGTVGVFSGTFKKLDSHIKNSMDNLRRNHFFHADDYIQYLPAITYLTFGSLDVKAKHSFKERVVVEATAYLAMTAIT
ncbi:MAG: hypothetical protein K2G09_05045, partial [Paramuribaculum sp.]|nr:hypothetical protein [Paramuribaculum sp.]